MTIQIESVVTEARMGDSSGGREREMRERDWDRERLLMSDTKETGHRSSKGLAREEFYNDFI